MERLSVMSGVKKGKFPSELDQKCNAEQRRLLRWMINQRPEMRPETSEILSDVWLLEVNLG